MKNNTNNTLLGIIMFIILMGLPAGWVVTSYFEAQSFNAITGKNVTTWQAMWVQLRVQEDSK